MRKLRGVTYFVQKKIGVGGHLFCTARKRGVTCFAWEIEGVTYFVWQKRGGGGRQIFTAKMIGSLIF